MLSTFSKVVKKGFIFCWFYRSCIIAILEKFSRYYTTFFPGWDITSVTSGNVREHLLKNVGQSMKEHKILQSNCKKKTS